MIFFSTQIKLENGDEFIQLSLFNDGYYPEVILGKEGQTKDMNVCVNSLKTEEGLLAKWFLASNRNIGRDEMVDRYACRFWIEESFKDLKSKLHWEKYTEKIPVKERLVKCIIISSLSYALQTALGGQLHMSASEKKTTSLFNKFRQVIRRGTQELEDAILNFINIIKTYVKRTEQTYA